MKNMRALFPQAQRNPEEMQMRMGISIGGVVAIALIWSVLAMSGCVPIVSDDVAPGTRIAEPQRAR
jgi:hypothetical protein